jgi:hypothetical protein
MVGVFSRFSYQARRGRRRSFYTRHCLRQAAVPIILQLPLKLSAILKTCINAPIPTADIEDPPHCDKQYKYDKQLRIYRRWSYKDMLTRNTVFFVMYFLIIAVNFFFCHGYALKKPHIVQRLGITPQLSMPRHQPFEDSMPLCCTPLTKKTQAQ